MYTSSFTVRTIQVHFTYIFVLCRCVTSISFHNIIFFLDEDLYIFQDLLDDLVDLISGDVGDTWSILVFEREIAYARDRERERILNPKVNKVNRIKILAL